MAAMVRTTAVVGSALVLLARAAGWAPALRGLGAASYSMNFKWYPKVPYKAMEECADNDDSCFWRCGSGAWVLDNKGCSIGDAALDQGWFDAVGDDCQTIGDVGARSTDEGAIFFGVEQSGQLQSELYDDQGRKFFPVLVLFGSDYCTGPWQEYYGQGDSWEPQDLDGHTPGAHYFKSARIYMKPDADGQGVDGQLGIKTVFFPYFDMAPYDETICKPCADEGGLCGGKSLYTPWEKADEWPGLDCVSSDDRISCFGPDDQAWYATVNGNGGGGYGCVDFAGCTICNGGSDQQLCEDNCPDFGFAPDDWCTGSPIVSLGAYPLGSFYYHLYFSTKTLGDNGEKSYCGDMSSPDNGKTYDLCTPGSSLYSKYQDYCVATRFFNCQDVGADCDEPYTCPKSVNQARYHYTSMRVLDLCGGNLNTGGCFNTMPGGHQPERIAECGNLAYWDGTSSQESMEWPLKTTCYVTSVVKCDDVLGQW